MKISMTLGCAMLSLAAFAAETPKTQATLTMADGSSIKGELLTEEIKGLTAFDQKVAVPAALLRSVTPGTTNTPSKLLFTNGDLLSVKLLTDEFKLQSLLGKLAIPATNVRKADFYTGTAAAGPLPAGLVYWCTFDGPASITAPIVGPAGVQNKGTFVPGHNGQALLMQREERNAVTVKFPAGTVGPRGCIEFWAQINDADDRYDDYCNPCFFQFYKDNDSTSIDLRYAANNGAGLYGLSTYTFDRVADCRGTGEVGRYSAMFRHGACNGWHHYAIVWDMADGANRSMLYLDGEHVADSRFRSNRADRHFVPGQAYTLDLYWNDGAPAKNPDSFLMDDFKIWNTPKTEF